MNIRVEHGDCRDVARTFADGSIDACVTDPPYSLVSIQKRFGKPGSAPAKDRDGLYKRASAGFMGQQWDTGETAFDPDWWREVYRVLKPGAHLIAFSGTRTYHRLACAIEDAGFEIRDQLAWCYGAGFPKSHSINKALDGKICDCEHPEPSPEYNLRVVHDADVSAASSVASGQRQVLFPCLPEQGASAEALQCAAPAEGCCQLGLEGRRNLPEETRKLCLGSVCQMPAGVHQHGACGRLCDGTSVSNGEADRPSVAAGGSGSPRGSQAAEQRSEQSGTVAGQPEPQDGGAWPDCGRCGKPIVPDGIGTALKPAWEPIVLARKPLDGTVAANVLLHGTGALNVDACRVAGENPSVARRGYAPSGTPGEYGHTITDRTTPERFAEQRPGEALGRWPANLVHDGSDEVLEAFAQFGERQTHGTRGGTVRAPGYGSTAAGSPIGAIESETGSAARFFFSAKADADDRCDSKHPTVKPIALMRWLVRLVTPPGGTVLDPFAGSGTTGAACMREGFDAILIEREAEYVADIKRRLDRMQGLDSPLFQSLSSDQQEALL